MTLRSLCPLSALVWLVQATEPVPPPPRRPPSLGAPAARAWVPAPLKARETARYRLVFGGVDVGDLTVTVAGRSAATAGETIRVAARAEGSLLGLGHFRSTLDGDFDPILLASRRWTSVTAKDDQRTRVEAEQARPGYVDLQQTQNGTTRRLHTFMRGAVVDPVGFLLRLRARPPRLGEGPTVLRVLDGGLLWRMTLGGARAVSMDVDGRAVPATRLDGRIEPIFYDGSAARDGRSGHPVQVWLADDETRLPLRFEIPLDVGTLTIRLIDVTR